MTVFRFFFTRPVNKNTTKPTETWNAESKQVAFQVIHSLLAFRRGVFPMIKLILLFHDSFL